MAAPLWLPSHLPPARQRRHTKVGNCDFIMGSGIRDSWAILRAASEKLGVLTLGVAGKDDEGGITSAGVGTIASVGAQASVWYSRQRGARAKKGTAGRTVARTSEEIVQVLELALGESLLILLPAGRGKAASQHTLDKFRTSIR